MDHAFDVHDNRSHKCLDEHLASSAVTRVTGSMPAHHLAQLALDPPMLPTFSLKLRGNWPDYSGQ
jgi:hypothetical protein